MQMMRETGYETVDLRKGIGRRGQKTEFEEAESNARNIRRALSQISPVQPEKTETENKGSHEKGASDNSSQIRLRGFCRIKSPGNPCAFPGTAVIHIKNKTRGFECDEY